MDLHEILEVGKHRLRTASGNNITFSLIVHEVKEDLFVTHMKNVGKQRINDTDLYAAAPCDKLKNKEMEQTIEKLKKQLL